jgi:hypothetical protein
MGMKIYVSSGTDRRKVEEREFGEIERKIQIQM